MRALLKWAGVKPPVEVTDGYVPLPQFDVVRLSMTRPPCRLLRDDTDSRAGPEVVVNFPTAGYATRRGRTVLGAGQVVSGKRAALGAKAGVPAAVPDRRLAVTGGSSVGSGDA